MARFIGFLRAVNVGKRQVKMERLREVLSGMGLANVETFIASGNIAFETAARSAPALERRIEGALQDAFGFRVETFLRTPEELAAVAEHDAFPGQAGRVRYVGFLREAPDASARERVAALANDLDLVAFDGREIHALTRRGIGEPSPLLGPGLEKTLGAPTTLRNVTTVRKLSAKYPPAG